MKLVNDEYCNEKEVQSFEVLTDFMSNNVFLFETLEKTGNYSNKSIIIDLWRLEKNQ